MRRAPEKSGRSAASSWSRAASGPAMRFSMVRSPLGAGFDRRQSRRTPPQKSAQSEPRSCAPRLSPASPCLAADTANLESGARSPADGVGFRPPAERAQGARLAQQGLRRERPRREATRYASNATSAAAASPRPAASRPSIPARPGLWRLGRLLLSPRKVAIAARVRPCARSFTARTNTRGGILQGPGSTPDTTPDSSRREATDLARPRAPGRGGACAAAPWASRGSSTPAGSGAGGASGAAEKGHEGRPAREPAAASNRTGGGARRAHRAWSEGDLSGARRRWQHRPSARPRRRPGRAGRRVGGARAPSPALLSQRVRGRARPPVLEPHCARSRP